MVLSRAFPDAPWAESLVRVSAAGVKLEIRKHVIYKETTESTFRKLKTHAQSNSDSFFLGPAISFRVPLGLCDYQPSTQDAEAGGQAGYEPEDDLGNRVV